MTVQELISRLGELDPGLPVIMPSEHFDYSDVEGAFVDLVARVGQSWMLTDERDEEGFVEVVRLFGPDE